MAGKNSIIARPIEFFGVSVRTLFIHFLVFFTSSVTWCYIICPGEKCTQKIYTALQNEFSNSMQHEPCSKKRQIMEKISKTSSVTWCVFICIGEKCTQKIFTALQNEFSNSMQHEPCSKNRQKMEKICKTSSVTWRYFICPGGKMHAESFYSIAERVQ